MKPEILTEWNPWWVQRPGFNLIKRELEEEIIKWVDRKEIIGILGVRRCGKTSLLNLLIGHLLKFVDPKNILFIKCDDDRVDKNNLISNAIDLYRELMNPKDKIFVFIDEIQESENWENTLKRMYDLEKDVKIFISGSSFSLMREDFAAKLAGRFAYFDLYPFGFLELTSKNLGTRNKITLISKKREIKHHLLRYIEFGGFPEIVLEENKTKKVQLLQFYYDTIVYRDIIRRREIRNPDKMEKLINYFLQNISNPANFLKIGKQTSLSTDSVSEYVKYLQDAFFIFSVPLFSFSVKKQEINPKKIYCVDTGLRNIKGFRFSEDYGRLAENIVFVEIRRRNSSNPLSKIFYWKKETKEVDFVVMDGLKIKELIQVCWNMENKEIKDREASGLLKALEEFKLSKGLVLTEEFEGEEKLDGKTIIYKPLWKWLLRI